MGDQADWIIDDGLLERWGVFESYTDNTYTEEEEDMADYTAVVDFALWPNDGRSGNQPHHRSGKLEMTDALLREMVDARKRGETVYLQVAAWDNTSREDASKKYLGCKLSVNGYLMNKEAKAKEDSGGGTYAPQETSSEEAKTEGDEVGSTSIFD